MILLDSAAVVGFLDGGDRCHAAAVSRIRALVGRESLVVSVITYAELLTGASVGHHARLTIDGFFAELIDDVHPIDRVVADRAAELRGQTSLKMPDALILATADVHQVDLVVTGDARWANVDIGPAVELLAAQP